MPIFEYTCQSCGHHFEHLIRTDHSVACPACDGKSLQKHLSTFAVRASGSGAPQADFSPGPCGTCGDPRGPGSCSVH